MHQRLQRTRNEFHEKKRSKICQVPFQRFMHPLRLCNRIQERAVEKLVRAWSFRLLDLKRLLQEGLGLRGSLFRDGGTTPGTTDLEDGLQLRAIWEGVGPGHHLDNEAAEGPDVGLAGIRGLLDDLRGHPEHGSLQRRTVPVARCAAQNIGRLHLFGDTEIGNLDPSLIVDQDVGTLDISVNDLTAVKVCETSDDLAYEAPNKRFPKGTVRVEHGLHRATSDVLEENIEMV